MEPPKPTIRPSDYQVFMLRLWRENPCADGAEAAWRFSLESPATHHRRGFESLEDLAAFLSNQTREGHEGTTLTEGVNQ